MMKWRPIWLLFTILVLNALVVGAVEDGEEDSDSLRLELFHRHSPAALEEIPISDDPLDRFKELLHLDGIRKVSHFHKRRQLSQTDESLYNGTVNMPMQSAADVKLGLFFVAFKVGTPPQRMKLVADTGSDLTWMHCSSERRKVYQHLRKKMHPRRIFRTYKSSSFKMLPCSSLFCQYEFPKMGSLPDECENPRAPCAYYYEYGDGTKTWGFFAHEIVTVGRLIGRKTKIPNVAIGCGDPARSRRFQDADGVLGLGYDPYSFARTTADIYGGKFSYCLPDHFSHKNVTTYLTFGKNKDIPALNHMQYTQLLLESMGNFYGVNLTGISIGNKMLKIPSRVWDPNLGGGTMVDSGYTLTVLHEPAYNAVMDALMPYVAKFEKLDLGIGVDYCFNETGFNIAHVPRLTFHFGDGARFEPPAKSYFIEPGVDAGVRCLGFTSTTFPGTAVIGNIIQQNNFWEFDLINKRLGYAPSAC